MTETDSRAREFRLRRQAKELGLRISKARGMKLEKYGRKRAWSVAKLGTGEYVLGGSCGGNSLDEVEAYLNTPVL